MDRDQAGIDATPARPRSRRAAKRASVGEPELRLDGTAHRLDPRVRIVWAVSTAVPIIVVGLAGAVLASAFGSAELVGLIVGVALLATLIGVAIVGWRWRCWEWSAWDDAIELQHGVITRRESVVPYHRIQQIDIHRDLVDRMLGLSKLILRTAAATTDAVLPGIAMAHADELRHELLHRSGHDDAV